jgi:Cu/Ag efflux protein CusF
MWWWREVWRLRQEVATIRETITRSASSERRWTARGVIRVLAPEINRLFIDHEDIPGLMEGMTMAFEAADPALFNGLTPGEVVRFTLERRDEKVFLVAIRKDDKP